MTKNLDFSVQKCLVWETVKPLLDGPRESPSFSYLGIDYYFRFTLSEEYNPSYKDSYVYYLDLHRRDNEHIKNVFSHTVFIIFNNSCIAVSRFRQENNTPRLKIHNATKYNTSMYGQWSVFCNFLSESPIEILVNRSETMCLSNLSDLVSPDQHNPTESCTFLKAQLAACAPFDCQSGLENLSFDFTKLLEQKCSSDVTLNCGGDTFHAHRLILSTRSEVFATMFQNPMVENETGVMDITDIDGEILRLLLNHVYSGKVPDLNVDNVSSLYIASDKYAIHHLKIECSKWILRNLTSENCLDFLFLADSCSDDRLKDRLVTFVAEVLPFLEKEEWMKFRADHPILAMCVVERRAFSK